MRSHRRQFSLRTMFLATTLFAALLAVGSMVGFMIVLRATAVIAWVGTFTWQSQRRGPKALGGVALVAGGLYHVLWFVSIGITFSASSLVARIVVFATHIALFWTWITLALVAAWRRESPNTGLGLLALAMVLSPIGLDMLDAHQDLFRGLLGIDGTGWRPFAALNHLLWFS